MEGIVWQEQLSRSNIFRKHPPSTHANFCCQQEKQNSQPHPSDTRTLRSRIHRHDKISAAADCLLWRDSFWRERRRRFWREKRNPTICYLTIFCNISDINFPDYSSSSTLAYSIILQTLCLTKPLDLIVIFWFVFKWFPEVGSSCISSPYYCLPTQFLRTRDVWRWKSCQPKPLNSACQEIPSCITGSLPPSGIGLRR